MLGVEIPAPLADAPLNLKCNIMHNGNVIKDGKEEEGKERRGEKGPGVACLNDFWGLNTSGGVDTGLTFYNTSPLD